MTSTGYKRSPLDEITNRRTAAAGADSFHLSSDEEDAGFSGGVAADCKQERSDRAGSERRRSDRR